MEERLTEWDEVRQIYRLKPDCKQCENIQKLGKLEDMEEDMKKKGEDLSKYRL